MVDWIIPLVSVLAGGGSLAAIVVALINRPKTEAEARDISLQGTFRIVDAAGALSDHYRDELARMASKLEELEADVEQVKATNALLQAEIDDLRRENRDLRARCAHLEEENTRLRKSP